jgi:hypothetical protein
MTLIDLIRRASAGYEEGVPESPLTWQVRPDGTPLAPAEYEAGGCEDALARFLVAEIAETYDPDAGDEAQLAGAAGVISNARRNLDNILHALGSGLPTTAVDPGRPAAGFTPR